MLVDHAFTLPHEAALAGQAVAGDGRCRSASTRSSIRCPRRALLRAGQAVGRAIGAWDSDMRVVVIGTGGLSHQLDGERAGFINKDFDLQFMDSLVAGPRHGRRSSRSTSWSRQTGTQGVELLMWLATRGALGPAVRCLHSNYHLPISNTASGLMLFEKRCAEA